LTCHFNKAADVLDLLKPFDAGKMEAFEVSTKVNTPKNDEPSLVERVD
jgi:putative SOS response-associated peptidase YedK